jgi:aarF domain-containing kinase
LIRSQADNPNDYELVFIDAGITCELEPRDAESLIDLCACIVRGDGAGAGKLMMERARLNSCTDPEAFQKGMSNVLNKLMIPPPSSSSPSLLPAPMVRLSTVQIGEILGEVLNLCRVHGVLLETNFVSVICAITVLEGLGRALDPQIDVIAEATPFILRAAGRLALNKAERYWK